MPQIAIEFQGAYDHSLPTIDNLSGEDTDYECSPEEALYHRHLSQWRLVDASRESTTDEADNPTESNPRLGLPEIGLFSTNRVLYGWLQPVCASHEYIFVRLSKLDRWVVNRSKEHRGYWVMTSSATYWLQDPCDQRIEDLASQEDLHLQYRIRLGLLSVLIDHFSNMSDDEVVEASRTSPCDFLSQLHDDNVSATAIDPNILSWTTVRPYANFLGTHLVLLRHSLTVSCPLLLGFLKEEQETTPSESSNRPNCRRCSARNGKRKRYTPTTRSSSTPEDQIPSNIKAGLSHIASKLEKLTQQQPWGEPVSVISTEEENPYEPLREQDGTYDIKEKTKAGSPNNTVGRGEIALDTESLQFKVDDDVNRDPIRDIVPCQFPGRKNGKNCVRREDEQGQGRRECVVTYNVKEGPRQEPGTDLHSEDHSRLPYTEGVKGTLVAVQKALLLSRLKAHPLKKEEASLHDFPIKNEVKTVGALAFPTRDAVKEETIRDGKQQANGEGTVFQFRKGKHVVSVCIHDLSMCMSQVLNAAKEADTLNAVFGWQPSEQIGIDEGTLTIQIRAGLMYFTNEHFVGLTAQDVVDVSPLPAVQDTGSCTEMERPGEVELELEVIDA